MHPARPSEARLGRVHSIFFHIQICSRLLWGSCVRLLCILHAHISSNGSHFLTASFLVYFTYMVRKIVCGQTKLEVTMYSKYSPHSDSYQVTKGELIKVTMYSAHINSNGSHFLTAKVLVY